MNPQKRSFDVEYEASTMWLVACVSVAAGAAIGAAAMYLLDPNRGKVRRARLADGAASKGRRAMKQAAAKAEDLFNRSRGVLAKAENLVRSEAVEDSVIAERVRSLLGHFTHRANGVESEVRDGMVILRGTVAEPEKSNLVSAMGKVPGVKSVLFYLAS